MKRLLLLLLALGILLGLCACKSDENAAMAKELKTGVWTRTFTALGTKCSEDYSFKNGGKFVEASLMGSSLSMNEGTYKITKNTIELTYDSGDTKTIHYTFEDGHLELTIRGSSRQWQLVHNQ